MRSWERVFIVGIVVMLVGATATVLHQDDSTGLMDVPLELLGIVALGVGTSVLASALVARVFSTQVFGLDVAEAVEALRGSSPFSRSEQELEIKLRLVNGEVRVSAVHRFMLRQSSHRARRHSFKLYTDIARWGSAGGFQSVCGPDSVELRDADLQRHLTEVDGKVRFERIYNFRARTPDPFTIVTYGLFRTNDRLIWTVEHISSDFKVKVEDHTGLNGPLDVKINHHREADIVANLVRLDADGVRTLEFRYVGEVLPFQGFEVQWSLT